MKSPKGLRTLWGWLVLVLSLISLHWFATSTHGLLEHWITWNIRGLYVLPWLFLVVMITMLVFVYCSRNTLLTPHTRRLRPITPTAKKHLVVFLSNPNVDKNKLPSSGIVDTVMEYVSALKASAPGCNWEMPLRAINHHMKELVSVSVVCSESSIKHADLFSSLLGRIKELHEKQFFVLGRENDNPRVVKIDEATSLHGFEFEDFDQLSEGLAFLIQELERRLRARKHDVIIDFTGGTKVASVTAASITFNSRIECQYVDTTTLEVRGYDLRMTSGSTGGLDIPG